ncbi:hypothetical protein L1049_009584 [Liquidambar formosana]|uniref:Protein PHLOEM PROTEIN 2-LIKE A9-like n=1 Tax=Liquidambar formosana TaxID=63359 RepID=A0AAP0R3L4_LIQFO
MASNPHYIAVKDFIDKKPNENPTKFTFYPKALNIVWGNDGRYWSIPKNDSGGSDTRAAAELLQVSWLEVTGSMDLQPGKKYRVGFNVELKPDAFGWNGCPVYLMAKVGKKGRYKWKKINLQDQGEKPPYYIADQFSIDSAPSTDKTLYFGLYEVWSGKWKGGLKLNHAIVEEVTPQ